MRFFLHAMTLALITRSAAAGAVPSFPSHLVGEVDAVTALLERVLGAGGSEHFTLLINQSLSCPEKNNCFTLEDGADGKIMITGSTASELTGGLGVYLREYCGMTIGWVRGGGSNTFIPKTWPSIFSASDTDTSTDTSTDTAGSSTGTDASGAARVVIRSRSVPYSHVTQVCTHSYTLVWHDWLQWERFIDWMALAGHNSIVAPTGQEEVQYKVRGTIVCILMNRSASYLSSLSSIIGKLPR